MNEDRSHLNALAIAHYVLGGFGVFFACFPLLHAAVGLSIMTGVTETGAAMGGSQGEPPAIIGVFFFSIGLLFFLMGQAVSIMLILSGRYLNRRRNYMFSFVLACVACVFFPFGTVLGVFTILVLSRESVKGIYAQAAE